MTAHGLPSFRQVLTAIAEAWSDRRDEAVTQGAKVAEAIARTGRLGRVERSRSPTRSLRAAFARAARRRSTPRCGGFGGAPKFPQPMTLEFVPADAPCGAASPTRSSSSRRRSTGWPAAGSTTSSAAGSTATRPTSDGSCRTSRRCSTTTRCSRACTRARGRSRGDDRYRTRRDRDAATTCSARCGIPEGGFFSSQDADSEGVEGKFFVVVVGRARRGSSARRSRARSARRPRGTGRGRTCCGAALPLDDGRRRARASSRRARARPRRGAADAVRAPRARVRPGTDDKVLAAWNGAGDRRARRGRDARSASPVRGGRGPGGRVRARAPARRLGAAPALLAGRRAGRPAFADDYAVMARACLTSSTRPRSSCGGSSSAVRSPTSSSACSATPSAAASSRRVTTQRRSSSGRRTCTTTPSRAATPPRPRCCCGWRSSRASPSTSGRRVGAAAGPRRDGGGADRVRARALRARPLRPPSTRWRSSATPRRSRPAPSSRRSPEALPAQPRPRRRRLPAMPRPRRGRAPARPAATRWPAHRVRLRALRVQAPRHEPGRARRSGRPAS